MNTTSLRERDDPAFRRVLRDRTGSRGNNNFLVNDMGCKRHWLEEEGLRGGGLENSTSIFHRHGYHRTVGRDVIKE